MHNRPIWIDDSVEAPLYKADIAGGALMLPESRRVARLLIDGVGKEEWRRKIEQENILQKRSPSTAIRQANLIRSRLQSTNSELWQLIVEGPSTVATQALFAAAIEHSPLLADFLPVVRARFRVLHSDLPRRIWIDYVERCHDVDPRMPRWEISTIDKLGDTAFRILHEVGFLTGGRRNLLRPVGIDPSIIKNLKAWHHDRALERIRVSA
ncbi:conserved hypothetical protein [Aurantimonas manganoxydans SI85-9A1]|uniref:Uncharacterized protein n=1 Tax=Aurantimonas manganoxydans (strain ATCC BAA-1229 / DSM 21871 / SI85-9A1) TaxID=287752 RepID=Q1YJT9_AURMS|nr:DUF1819 family protein [Aurantimonas manganoxydans]EAS50784.1 conserved hypothetical protein [Aurantimonas manganoxydans SI85-9A1]